MPAMRTIARDLVFSEGPRWHEGELWFSDMHGNAVLRTNLDGDVKVVAEVPDDRPSGLGWLPDGRLLFVAMEAQKLMRVEPNGAVVEHADMSGIAAGSVNDMIVAADGTAYVGDMGMFLFRDEPGPRGPGQTIRVTPDGEVSCAADELMGPNGHILTEDGRTLIVAESRASRLTAFDVDTDGTLSNRRLFAELSPVEDKPMAPPDGMCLDAEGAVWVAEVLGNRLLRVRDGGEITDTLTFDGDVPVACVLGGEDRRTLLVCVVASINHHVFWAGRTSRVEAIEVPVPGAGRP
jgi:sugar lactone lactonase YvrE